MQSRKLSAKAVDRLKDEVYRQMLRLEGGRPAAQQMLAVALVQAWMAIEQQPLNCEARKWLRTLSPVCLHMIEEASPTNCDHCVRNRPSGTGATNRRREKQQ